jgi:hypothetical protein
MRCVLFTVEINISYETEIDVAELLTNYSALQLTQ